MVVGFDPSQLAANEHLAGRPSPADLGIVLGAIVLQEAIDSRMIIGTALVISGIALVNRRRSLRPGHANH